MNDNKLPAGNAHLGRYGEQRRANDVPLRTRPKAEGLEAHSNWLNRGEKAGTPAVHPVGRHSAITRNLYNWTSYKTWADKMRNSWEGEREDKGGK